MFKIFELMFSEHNLCNELSFSNSAIMERMCKQKDFMERNKSCSTGALKERSKKKQKKEAN